MIYVIYCQRGDNMKIDRLIAIITLLLREEKITAPELARRFEVSRRTITRDIDDICRAGIPLVTAQGYGGGISIIKGYRLDKTVLTHDEWQMLFAGFKGMSSVSGAAVIKPLFEKLFHRDSVADDCFIIDLASFGRPALSQKIDQLKAAISLRHLICFRYDSGKGESSRLIEPYYIVFKWSSWYVFGYCRTKQDFRLFKLSRLWNLKDTQEAFVPRAVPPEKLHFDDHLSQVNAHLKAVFAASERYRLTDEYGVGCCTALESGDLLFERDFTSYDNMREWILSFGSRVTVLEPAALRADIISEAEKILAVYDTNKTY